MPKSPLGLASIVLMLGMVAETTVASGKEVACTPQPTQVIVRFTYGSEKEAWIRGGAG